MSLGREIYSGSAALGNFTAKVSAGVGTVLGLALIVGGIIMLRKTGKESKTSESATGVVQQANTTANKDGIYQYLISFFPESAQASISLQFFSSNMYAVGDKVTVYYNNYDVKGTATLNSPGSTKLVEAGCIVLGVIIIGGVWINLYMVTHYRVLGAAEGAGQAIGAARQFI